MDIQKTLIILDTKIRDSPRTRGEEEGGKKKRLDVRSGKLHGSLFATTLTACVEHQYVVPTPK